MVNIYCSKYLKCVPYIFYLSIYLFIKNHINTDIAIFRQYCIDIVSKFKKTNTCIETFCSLGTA